MYIMGIETSCDETGVAIYDKHNGLLANELYSQSELHSNYGGVVPELASRDHVCKVVPLIQSAMKHANLHYSDINGIAYTAGPGLIGSLMVGASISKSLAYSLRIPSIAINHMEAHLLSPMLENRSIKFPFLALLISGGHTQLVLAKGIGKYQLLGESVDDSLGETFDKIAKALGLSYPGGPILEKIAKDGKYGKYIFPKPMTNRPGLNFSFSGLKTSVINVIRSSSIDINTYQVKADIARAFEEAVIGTLVIKCERAIKITRCKRLVISGGVSANQSIRSGLSKMIKIHNGEIFYTSPEFCTDNGAMIAYVGSIRLETYKQTDLSISVRSSWPLEELSEVVP